MDEAARAILRWSRNNWTQENRDQTTTTLCEADIQAYTVLHKQISANPARPDGRHSPKSFPPSSPGATAQIINNQMDLTPHKQYHMAINWTLPNRFHSKVAVLS